MRIFLSSLSWQSWKHQEAYSHVRSNVSVARRTIVRNKNYKHEHQYLSIQKKKNKNKVYSCLNGYDATSSVCWKKLK